MTATILITGFGPFPGAPYNPTGPLVMASWRAGAIPPSPMSVASRMFSP